METIYYFDRIRIYSKIDKKTLMEFLPVDELKSHCKHFEIGPGFKHFFRSQIDVVAPDYDFLLLLQNHENALDYYKITYIEITKDVPYQTEWAACKAVIDNPYRQKWGRFHKTFFNDIYYSNSRYCGILGLISGTKHFKCCAYACFSKVTGEPCHHREWRISRANNIKKKSGIRTIKDLLEFDFPSFFKKTDSRYSIPMERTDQRKLGLYLTGMGNRNHLTKRQLMHIGCIGHAYSKGAHAETVEYLKILKTEIDKLEYPKSEIEERISTMTNYNRFMVPLY